MLIMAVKNIGINEHCITNYSYTGLVKSSPLRICAGKSIYCLILADPGIGSFESQGIVFKYKNERGAFLLLDE